MKIAILIPAYNAGRFIEAALDSVAKQSRRPDEVIVVDDGSIDNTADVVETWRRLHPEMALLLVTQANEGASAARNKALRSASSGLVAFLDADDLLEPGHLQELSAALLANPDLVAVFADQSVFTVNGERCASFLAGKRQERISQKPGARGVRILSRGLWCALVRGNFIPTSASMVYRQVALDVGLFDTGLATSEDRDFWLRVSRRGSVGFLPRVLARKREHESNLSGDMNSQEVSANALEVLLKQMRMADSLGLSETERSATEEALKLAVVDWLYFSSRRGIRGYRLARKQIKHEVPEFLTMDTISWLRAVFYSLRRKKNAA
ncbi:glycosyltransferase family A protein [Pseudohaliea sp.]|uniref:glycosyltransferase family 2 protein n=1 Tax=Pseudohaliea sp. TaxID=2740289 RepID=UPI0032EEE27B